MRKTLPGIFKKMRFFTICSEKVSSKIFEILLAYTASLAKCKIHNRFMCIVGSVVNIAGYGAPSIYDAYTKGVGGADREK